MNNEERDRLIQETHDGIQVLQTKWEMCPARLRAMRDNRLFLITVLAVIVAALGVLAQYSSIRAQRHTRELNAQLKTAQITETDPTCRDLQAPPI